MLNSCWFYIDARVDKEEFTIIQKEFSKNKVNAWFQKYEDFEEYDYDNQASINVSFKPSYFMKKD